MTILFKSCRVFSNNQYMYIIYVCEHLPNLKSWFKLIKFQNTRLWSSSSQHSLAERFTTLYISSSRGDKLWRLHDLVRTESMIFFPVKLLIICAVQGGTRRYTVVQAVLFWWWWFNWKPLLLCSILSRRVDSMFERLVIERSDLCLNYTSW